MVKFLKIRAVRNPEREFGNAGIDVFVPIFTKQYLDVLTEKNPGLVFDSEGFWVYPGCDILIPLGLKTRFSGPEIALEATNKSGIATKKKLIFGATLVDYSYTGEIHAHLINVGNKAQRINFGDKIIQFVPRMIDFSEHEIAEGISEEEFYKGHLEIRDDGAFGSTGV